MSGISGTFREYARVFWTGRLIALRCVGFNNVDMKVAAAAKLTVVRAAGYSPYSVAEHAVGLMLSLNRKVRSPRRRGRCSPGVECVLCVWADPQGLRQDSRP